MAESTEVAIIGGGAAGGAAAWYLSRAGISSTIIEREGVASQASGYAAGGLNPLTGTGIPGPLADFAWESFRLHLDLYPELKTLTEIDYQLRQTSEIMLTFDQSSVSGLEDIAERFTHTNGFSASMTSESQVQEIDRRISTDFAGCVFKRGNYSLDSQDFTRALHAAALASGATHRPGSVRGLEASHGQVSRVLLDDGEIECGQVLLAMGPWSRMAESWLNTYIPVDPLKGEISSHEIAWRPPGARCFGRRRQHLRQARRSRMVRHHRGLAGLRPPAAGRHKGADTGRSQAHSPGHSRRGAGDAHRLPPTGHPRLAARHRPRPRLRQRLACHRRRQEGHPAGARLRQVHSRPYDPGRYRPIRPWLCP